MIVLSDVNSIINQLLPEPHAGLLNGTLFGTKASLSPDLKEALIRSGTLHIAALSGMNITILVNLTTSTLLRIFSRKITSLLTIGIIIGFVLFVGISPSVIRAAVMGCMLLISSIFGRERIALYSLVCTSLVMIIAQPLWIHDISFQLSFLATFGLIIFDNTKNTLSEQSFSHAGATESFHHHASKIVIFFVNFIKDDIHATLAAQVFTLPIFFFEFHRISLLSPLSNLLIGFVIPPITVLGLLLCVISYFFMPLSIVLSWVIWCALEYILTVIFAISWLPFSSFQW